MGFESTQKYRNEILAYLRDKVGFESYQWITKIMTELNKYIIGKPDSKESKQIENFYSMFVRFYEEWAEDKNPGYYLLSFYMVGIELGVCSPGGNVEVLTDFRENIDIGDWINMKEEDVKTFDRNCFYMWASKNTDGDFPKIDYGDAKLIAGGLITFDGIKRVVG